MDCFENDFGELQWLPTLPDYQAQGVDAIINRFKGRVLLGDEMGLGKTVQILTAIAMNSDWLPAIIVCPATIKHQWASEIRNHIGRFSIVLDGRRSRLEDRAPFTIINYDVFRDWESYLRLLNPKTIVIDETQNLSNPESLRTQSITRFCREVYIPHRMGLSGMPANNRLIELFPMLHIIRPDLFPSLEQFAELCKGPDASINMNKLLRRVVMIRRRKAEVELTLPTMSRTIVPLDLPDRTRYTQIETQYFTWMKHEVAKQGGTFDAKKVKRHEKLMKISYLRREIANLKFPIVRQWIDKFFIDPNNNKLIVFGIHRDFIRRLSEWYGHRAVVINGSKTPKQRRDAIERFNTDPSCWIMIANIDAGGVGWNGTIAHTALFAELPWSPSKLKQAEKRIDRYGQKFETNNIYLIAKDTFEETVCKILQAKQETLTECFDGRAVRHEEWKIHDEFLRKIGRRKANFWQWVRESFFLQPV